MHSKVLLGIAVIATTLAAPMILAGEQAAAGTAHDIVAALDSEYQAAVERNDWRTMDRILHRDFTLVLGNGSVVTRAEMIASARDREIEYEKQVEEAGTQVVRVFGEHTATVTALLVLKGTRRKDQGAFEYKLWFTDTYVLTADGWKYAFGQASARL
jgi:hypothetical protein